MTSSIKKPYYVFKCRQCGHLEYVKKEKFKKVVLLTEMNCPTCDVEGWHNWVLDGDASKKEQQESLTE
jgi:DNA replicative helicase MCM subunit Mcm2 (Cdc46/Mcm family)